MSVHRTLIVLGTRPELIKLAPVIRACREHPGLEPVVCLTGQHRELVDPLLKFFDVRPDYDLGLMKNGQSLAELNAACLRALDPLLREMQPDSVICQGDTTTAMAAAVSAFYHQIPLVHVEAGLRTDSLWSPWPEEYNRRVIGISAVLHCAPTEETASRLLKEGMPSSGVHQTGNTVIDAMQWALAQVEKTPGIAERHAYLEDRRMVLITSHRRENHGAGQAGIFKALNSLTRTFPDVEFVFSVHPNPVVRRAVDEHLEQRLNLRLIPPPDYPEFVWLMQRSYLILSDSGGIQEEAPSLKKPVLVLRDTTERPEAIKAGANKLVGTDANVIVREARKLLQNPLAYRAMQINRNPYGDGHAAERIAQLISELGVGEAIAPGKIGL